MEKTFLTIRQTASLGIIPERRLRAMLKEKRLPGIYSGMRFLVNVPQLRELLEDESRAAVKKGE